MRCAQMEQFNDYWSEGHRQSRFALPNDPIKTRCWRRRRRRRRETDPSTLSLTQLILNIISCIDPLIYDTNSTTTHSWEHTQVKNKSQGFLIFTRADATVIHIKHFGTWSHNQWSKADEYTNHSMNGHTSTNLYICWGYILRYTIPTQQQQTHGNISK